MKTITTKCVILGHKDFGEKNKLIFLYSEELGKIKAVAKGARSITSRFTGYLETLNTATASFYFGPKNIILTEIISEKNFLKNSNSLEKLTGAIQIANITNELIYDNQVIDGLYKLIKKTINHLSNTKKPLMIYLAYSIKLLDLLGKMPDFKDTNLIIEKKFMKFFHYLKTNDYPDIEKVLLTDEENLSAKRIIENLSHY